MFSTSRACVDHAAIPIIFGPHLNPTIQYFLQGTEDYRATVVKMKFPVAFPTSNLQVLPSLLGPIFIYFEPMELKVIPLVSGKACLGAPLIFRLGDSAYSPFSFRAAPKHA